MEAGSESVSLLAMTFLRHLLNVSLFAGLSAFVSRRTRRKTHNLDIIRRLPLLQAIGLDTPSFGGMFIPTVSNCTSGASNPEDDLRTATLICLYHFPRM